MQGIEIIEKLPEDGLYLENTDPLNDSNVYLNIQTAIILEFQTFMDGRAYSQARKLRNLGFKGTLIASGDIRPDQARQYARVGFSALHFSNAYDEKVISDDLMRFSVFYQKTSVEDNSVYERRIHDERLALLSGGGAFPTAN